MKSLLSLAGPQPQSKFTSSRYPTTSRGSCGGTHFNVSFQLRDSDILRISNHRNVKSASCLKRPLPSLLENSISLPLQLGSAVTAVLLGFSSASAYAATGEASSGVPEGIVSATTEALTDSIPAPLSAENSDAANVVISVLLTSAFIGLVVLTLGVAYLAVTDWQDKQEREKLDVSAMEERQTKKDKKPPGSTTPTRKPRGFGPK